MQPVYPALVDISPGPVSSKPILLDQEPAEEIYDKYPFTTRKFHSSTLPL
jgi:hypothetical protein